MSSARQIVTLIYLGLAWLSGILLADWLQPPLIALGVLAVPAAAGLLLWLREPGARRIAVCALVLLAGGARELLATPHFGPNDLATYNDRAASVTVVGVVDDEPTIRDTDQTLRLRAESLSLAGPVAGWVQITTPLYPIRAYGDRLSITGRLQTPPIDRGTSYRDSLARQDIYSWMGYPRIELLQTGQGSPFWQAMAAVKQRVRDAISLTLPEPHAGLLIGILLGVKSGIPRGLYDQFRITGASHIIVISGFNIAIICGIVMAVSTRLCGRRWAWLPTLVGLTCYVLLVGAEPPVVRAAVMGGLYVLALRLGRQTEARTSLILAAVAMTAVSPGMLSEEGFQLSFAATAGLIWIVPVLERAAQRGLPYLAGSSAPAAADLLSQGLLVTLAAQVATLPLIAMNFERLSTVSLITNALILPVQPLVMMTGGLTALAGSLWLPAGQVLGWLAWLPLAWTAGVVEWMSSFSFAPLNAGKLSPWLAAAAYVVLAILVWLTARGGQPLAGSGTPAGRIRLRASTRLALIVGVMVVLVAWLAIISLPDGHLHVAFLDVGQGDATLLTTPRGQQILIDGGPSPAALLWALDHHVPFWDRSLDMVINTHPEADHLAGLLAALERYQVNQVMVSDIDGQPPLYAAWQAALSQEGAAVVHAGVGMQINTQDGVQIEVLHPGDIPTDDHYNNHSVVIRVVMGTVSFLLPGDIEAGVEQGLVARASPLAATVLKVPHHGSATSSSPAFLRAIRPQLAVISVGDKNRFDLPEPEVVQRYVCSGIPLLRTDKAGTIEVVTDGEQLWVETERPTSAGDTCQVVAPAPVLQ